MVIRTFSQDDLERVYELYMEAFGDDERTLVAQLAVELLSDLKAENLVGLVAEELGDIIGCVIFSCITVNSVIPVNAGIAHLKNQGVDLVMVYGDPRYYARFGFRADHLVTPPYPVEYREAWMACELTDGAIASVAGKASCVSALSRPEYW